MKGVAILKGSAKRREGCLEEVLHQEIPLSQGEVEI
jgi:hypothetical protein